MVQRFYRIFFGLGLNYRNKRSYFPRKTELADKLKGDLLFFADE